MKPLFALLVTALLGVGFCACGSSSKSTATQGTSPPAANANAAVKTSTVSKNDRDNDGDNNDDDQRVLDFGHVANAADQQTITTLVTSYFAAAAAENGKKGCSLLAPFVAESIVESIGYTQSLRGKTCAVVMSKLFRHHHQELVNKSASLKIMRIGIDGFKSLVALDFPTIPEVRQITVRRTGNTWKILSLLDGIIE